MSAVPSNAMVRFVSSGTDSSYVFDLSVRSYIGSRLGLESGPLGQVTEDHGAQFRNTDQRLGPEKAMGGCSLRLSIT